MKYTLKRARGLFSIRRKAPETDCIFYPWKCGWTIIKRGTAIPRDAVKPFTTFADIYRANHAFGLI